MLLLLLLLPLTEAKSLTPSSDKDSPCSFQKGDYSLSWHYDDLSSDVVFKLSAKSPHQNFWSGLYMGEDAPTDAIGVFVRHGQIGLTDSHVSEDGVVADNLTDVQSLSFDLKDDKLTAEFARPLSPQDKTDADLAHCVTFFFPVVAPAIEMRGPIEVPSNLEKKRVCDVADSCASRDQTSLVKREEPPLCDYKHGQQEVHWRKEGDRFVFVFDHPAKKGKWWSSVGVGDSMEEMAMLVAFAENGKVKSAEGFTSVGYAVPKKDESNSHKVKLLSSSVKNNRAHYEISVQADFVKERLDNGCVTLQMAINSGKYAAKIQKHEVLPTAIPVCGIEHCSGGGKAKTTKKPKTTTVAIIDARPENIGAIVDGHEDNGGAIVDAHEEKKGKGGKGDKNGGAIVDAKKAENKGTTVDAQEISQTLANSDGNGETIVGAKEQPTQGSIVDFHESPSNESHAIVAVRTQGEQGAIVDVKETPISTDFNKDLASSIVDVRHPSGNTGEAIVDARNENQGTIVGARNEGSIVDVKEVTQGPSPAIVDVRNEEEFNKDSANGGLIVDTNVPKEKNAGVPEDQGSLIKGGSIVDAKESEQPTKASKIPETVIIGFRERPKSGRPGGEIVDVRVEEPIKNEKDEFSKDSGTGESIVDVHTPEVASKGPGGNIVDFRVENEETKTDKDKFNKDSAAGESIVDVHSPEDKPKDPTEAIVDLSVPKEVFANGTAELLHAEETEENVNLGGEIVKKDDNEKTTKAKGKPTTKAPKKQEGGKKHTTKGHTTKHPKGHNDTVEGSGHGEVIVGVVETEGSGDASNANNSKPSLEESIDQTENSVLNDLEPKANGTEEDTGKKLVESLLGEGKNVEEEKKKPSTTFSPPLSTPRLHSVSPIAAARPEVTSTQPTVAQTLPIVVTPVNPVQPSTQAPLPTVSVLPSTPNPSNIAWVPKVCVSQDLRVCDSYFEDYLSKVSQWSTKHSHTVSQSMWKACKLLSQVKHVPSMCCNRFKKECDAFSHQYA